MYSVRRAPARAAAAVMLSSCATPHPRAYTPIISPPPADPAAFQRDFSACASEVEANPDNFSSNKGEDLATGMKTSELAIIFLPLALLMPSGVNRRINENSVMTSMKLCLSKRGYTVSDWKLVEREVASGQLVTPMEFKPKWRAWLLPDGSTQSTPERIFDTLQQCQVGGLEALRATGATAGGYGCVAVCVHTEHGITSCRQAWMSDMRTGWLFDASALATNAVSDPKEKNYYLRAAARARRSSQKSGPVLSLPATPPAGTKVFTQRPDPGEYNGCRVPWGMC